MTAADIKIGIGSLLETFEMMLVAQSFLSAESNCYPRLFALLHLRAFTYRPYGPFVSPKSTGPIGRTPRLRSLGHAMDFRETFREMWSGWLYIICKIHGKEPVSDMGAKRIAYYQEAFGRPRVLGARRSKMTVSERKSIPDLPVEVDIEEHVDADIGGEKQWLGLGDNYGYGLRRERSDGLEIQVERELERRGCTPRRQSLKILRSDIYLLTTRSRQIFPEDQSLIPRPHIV
jgi:hypothetical protein